MASMRAVEIVGPGGPEMLVACRRAVPEPGPGEVLIAVRAAGINRPDVSQRKGVSAPPPGASDIPGLEVAGTVVDVAPDVGSLAAGDEVCALVAGGGYAEYCVAPARQCLPRPAGFSFVEAAALPETFFTVWSNLFDRARLAPGEVVLVHGGSSGIGTTAIQLAVAFGARVLATAGTAGKCDACQALGAERAINYREEDFVAAVADATGGRGVDIVLDMVGGDYVPRNIACLAQDGRHVSVAALRGTEAAIDLAAVMRKRLTMTGSMLRSRSVAEKGAIADRLREAVWPKLATDAIKPVIDSTFPLERADAAHALMESSAHVGKIVLVCAAEPLDPAGA